MTERLAAVPSEGARTEQDQAREAFANALQFRFACKLFDGSKKIPDADLAYILEAGRLSPSSLGLEPWRFLVIRDEALRRRLRSACWNQAQVTTASAVVVILALKTELEPDAPYARGMLARLLPPGASLDEVLTIYRDIAHEHRTAWSVAQCHIAAANMMTGAAVIGVDSCPMGGFEPEAVADVLGIDREKYAIALILALGYRAQPEPPKQRLPMSQIVTYR